jgi:hypothetical protein
LKNRAKPSNEDEKDWYDKAFGKKKNIMKHSIVYKPTIESLRKGRFDIYARINYQMFPEMEEEFDPSNYKAD